MTLHFFGIDSRLIRKALYFNHLVSFLAPMSFDLMRFALMRFHFLSFDLTISYFYLFNNLLISFLIRDFHGLKTNY
jgi:hypothetical protein